MTTTWQWILGSSSPRRRELLALLRQPFTVITPRVLEQRLPGEAPGVYVQRNSREKAADIIAQLHGKVGAYLVISADTIVVLDGDVLEKPIDAADAVRMLGKLSGREHQVLTSVTVGTLVDQKISERTCLVSTDVRLKKLSQNEILNYVTTGEPLDKAGAYGAQGYGGCFVQRLSGSYTNVVGLPMAELIEMLTELGCYADR